MKLFLIICQILMSAMHLSLYGIALVTNSIAYWGVKEMVIALSFTLVYTIVFLMCEKYLNEIREENQEEKELKVFEEYLEKL